MIKKILFSTVAILVSASSVFAYTQGNIVVSPEVGIGLAFAQISKSYKDEDGDDPKWKTDGVGLNWSVGVNCNYFLMDSLSLMGGVSLDSSYVDVKNVEKVKVETTMYRIIVPVGAHYHYNLSPVQIVLGGGLYLGTPPLYDKYKVKQEEETGNLKRTVDLGLFVDAGVSFETTKTSNLFGFLRFKSDLIGSDIKVKPEDKNKYEKLWAMRNMSVSLNVSYGFQIN